MPGSEVLPFPLYHGTSTWFLPDILERGFGTVNVHEGLRSRDFLKEAWALRLELAESEERDDLLIFPGSMISAMVEDRVTNGGFNFRYGQLYCTADERRAVTYASNAYGSELITEAAKLLHQVREISTEAADELISRYPEISTCLAYNHKPIVIKLDGVTRCSVRRENGETFTPELDTIARFLSFEVANEAAFSRIRIFLAENIVMGSSGAHEYDLIPFESGAAGAIGLV